MPCSHTNDYPADILARAARIKLACFDVDGTLTDGRLLFDSDGRELKAFHVHDGQGLVLLRKAGLQVALVTARTSPIVEQRAAELGVAAHMAIKDKLACVRGIATQSGITLEEVMFMGDDLPDLGVLQAVGLATAPANAHGWTRQRVHWRTLSRGGEGAAREVCDLLLAAQGRVDTLLSGAGPQ